VAPARLAPAVRGRGALYRLGARACGPWKLPRRRNRQLARCSADADSRGSLLDKLINAYPDKPQTCMIYSNNH
jgi:hypothetical protein